MKSITIALGNTPISNIFLEAQTAALNLEPKAIKPIHRAFRPMTEDTAFDVSELAIVTAIQAMEQNRNIVPLPISIASRIQHKCIIQNNNFTNLTHSDLEGRRVAVRAYSQTTGAWVRTILDTEYGVDCAKIEWITQEPPHVTDAPEPSNVIRDPNGASPLELIENGDVDAAIFGNDLPDAAWVKSVIRNAEEAGKISLEKTNITQINHILAVSRSFFEQREDDVKRIMAGFHSARQQLSHDEQRMLPIGEEEMQTSLETLLQSAFKQGLIGQKLGFNDIFGRGMSLYQTLSL